MSIRHTYYNISLILDILDNSHSSYSPSRLLTLLRNNVVNSH